MKNTTLLLFLLLSSKLAFAVDPDAVRAAYKKLNLEITADQKIIEGQYRKLITGDGVAFSKEGREIRQAKELIITFIKEYDIEILTDSNKSYIFKREYAASRESIKEKFMRLVEDNANRLKFAFTAPYSGDDWGGFDDSPRRAVRVRETIYPAFYEINSFYRDLFSKDLDQVDLKTFSAALDFQINSKISVVKDLKEIYGKLSLEGKETYSILMTVLADEGTRLDIKDIKRTEYFLNRIKTINEVSQSIKSEALNRFKNLFQKMTLEGGIIDGAYAPYYFDTLVLISKNSNSSLFAMASREIDEKFFLYYGTIAHFVDLSLSKKQENVLNKLAFQLAGKLKKDLGDNRLAIVDSFEEQKKRIALVLEIAGMADDENGPEILNMNIDELQTLRMSLVQEGKTSCMNLLNIFI